MTLQSHQIERQRISDLMRENADILSPEMLEKILKKVRSKKCSTSIPWKNGIEPMPLDQFAKMLTGRDMFPLQVKPFAESGILRSAGLLDPKRTIRDWLIIFGKGCLAAETPLKDERSGETRSIAEWQRMARPLLLKSYDGEKIVLAEATAPFVKGRELLYTVTLNDGRTFRCTAHHKCLTREGWKEVRDLVAGDHQLLTLPHLPNDQTPDSPSALYNTIRSISASHSEIYYDLTVPGTGCYFDANGVLHHNSGKDFMISIFLVWAIWVLHHLSVPPPVYFSEAGGFNLAPDTRLDVVNVAPNADLAQQVFFDYVKRHLQHDLFAHIPTVPPISQITTGTKHIYFPSINTHLYSKTSSSKGLDGFNLWIGIMDEADEFMDTQDKSNADIIHEIFSSSGNTRFHQFAMVFTISYPRYEDGFVLRHEKRCLKSPDLFYTCNHPTHEVRPDFDINDPKIQEEFENDPQGASAKYLCKPMATNQQFFDFPEKIAEALNRDWEPCAVLTESIHIDVNGIEYVAMNISDIKKQPGHIYFMGGDGAHSGDSYAICVGHIERFGDAYDLLCPECAADDNLTAGHVYANCGSNENGTGDDTCNACGTTLREWNRGHGLCLIGWARQDGNKPGFITQAGSIFRIPKFHEDLLIEIKPQRRKRFNEINRTVHLPSVQTLCEDLHRQLGITQSRFDPHQAVQVSQYLSGQGFDCGTISFSNPEQFRRAKLAKTLLNNGLISFSPNEKRDREWRRLQRAKNSVDHPPGNGQSK
ncbi:MAG: Hint domain-containing protein, partial [Chthonomonadales bacterium]